MAKEPEAKKVESTDKELQKEQVKKAPERIRKGLHPLNYVIVGVLLGGVGYMVYATHLALNPKSEEQAAVSSEQNLPALPQLKLNKNHVRQGPAVTLDPSQIGRDNPFLKP